ncbi:hypothetical protein Sipo8835_04315 [Streptomyces ipomoeae]|uniref:Uncharacterized protein n=2 Tax=Streptomyces ipomoeae TaxID=103232 RepID=A0AAE8W8X6_9ACTN|nr:hypothetical protein Sipo8835_04315 [Streptomyces ipomoeae]
MSILAPTTDPPSPRRLGSMLRTAEITAELTRPPGTEQGHQLYWRSNLEFSLDCFICERFGRTTFFERGAEKALCSGTRKGLGRHNIAARIAAFTSTSTDERLTARILIDFWWAPFEDARDGGHSAAPTLHPWVRLNIGYYCQESRESGKTSTQTNAGRPWNLRCTHCDEPLATDAETPAIRLLV